VIINYKDKKTRIFAGGEGVKEFSSFSMQAEKRLEILDAAPDISSLRNLPGTRFEALKGDRKGQYSIRINEKWRICFEWPPHSAGPVNVEIIDYH